MSEKIDKQLAKGEKLSKVMNGLEIKPGMNYLLVKPYVRNPYEKVEIRESGIITDETPKFKNPDSGEQEESTLGMIVARVLEIGPDVKLVKEGDDIYFHFGSSVPIPFFRQGLYVVAENKALVIINENLTERIDEYDRQRSAK